jgi:hypothetical protein
MKRLSRAHLTRRTPAHPQHAAVLPRFARAIAGRIPFQPWARISPQAGRVVLGLAFMTFFAAMSGLCQERVVKRDGNPASAPAFVRDSTTEAL